MRKPVWSGLVLCALLGCTGPKSSTGAGEEPQPPPSAGSPTEAPVEAPAEAPQPLQVTAAPAPKDDLILKGVELQGDTLVARVMHSGGCKPHTYELLWNGTFQQSAAGEAQAELVLAHDANGDSCEALLNRTASFDLGPLARRWREQNKGEHGAVELRFAGSQVTGRYSF
ncbi:hypothetical protein ACN28I_21290 [Archangium gephyra]|uniref:hypothetical protein n=1 Tax=Archangium gephyra TaxID=48 RepID=UPI003B77B030